MVEIGYSGVSAQFVADQIAAAVATVTAYAVPVGSIVAFHKTLAGCPALPAGWVECNGQVLSDGDSPFDGVTIPDLNGDHRFFRGNATSGDTGGTDAAHAHTQQGSGNTGGSGYPTPANRGDATSSIDARPAFMNVVWAMRVK